MALLNQKAMVTNAINKHIASHDIRSKNSRV